MQDPVPNPTSANSANDFTLEIKSVPSNISDGPVATLGHLMSGHEVPDEQQNRHHNVLCDRSDVGPGHLQDLDLFVDSFQREWVTLDLA